ncbi:MFS transporter [Saccharopolyspora sp. K220]|uniref:MFS transporter n=1 Tax=Saccharopolyspora soli TaxID=2926618 RepID=UPI001F55D3D2|nr:MFS transporter [Saccharopolyspora soli]MCI2419350.1 MFS transporter [Saccharopolyspora soli]
MSSEPDTANVLPPHPSSPPPRSSRCERLFGSLRSRNYRFFLVGRLFATTGAWVQRIAQDWLVLTLTDNAAAVGLTSALQFLPTLLFGLTGGWIADRWPKRQVLLLTQTAMAITAAALACLTLTHHVALWHVYLIAFALGTATAVDEPTRQAFVNEMVGPRHLRNAICLNASAFQFGALAGPAISGALIATVGPGYSFAVNALSYLAPISALLLIRPADLRGLSTVGTSDRRLREGMRYLSGNRDMLWPILLVGTFGLFTTNLPVTLAAYAKSVIHAGADGYGLLSAITAAGALIGALLSAQWSRTTHRTLFAIGGILAGLYVLTSFATNPWILAAFLLPIGATTTLLNTSANATVQLAAADTFRGRVMGVYILVFVGSGALGGPLLGTIIQTLGAHVGLQAAGIVPALAGTLLWFTRPARQRKSRQTRITSVLVAHPHDEPRTRPKDNALRPVGQRRSSPAAAAPSGQRRNRRSRPDRTPPARSERTSPR